MHPKAGKTAGKEALLHSNCRVRERGVEKSKTHVELAWNVWKWMILMNTFAGFNV